MSKVAVVAKVRTKAEHRVAALAEMRKLLEPTRSRDGGCLSYELYQDKADDAVFFFLEEWESEESLDAHLATAHVRAFVQAVDGMLASIEISRLTKVV